MAETAERLTAEYLWKVGNQLSSVCPAASRYFVFSMERRLLKDDQVINFGTKRQKMFCHHCGSIWHPGNHKVRIEPCPTLKKGIKKLLKCQRDQPWNLTKQQKKRILTFQKSTNKIVYRCFSCRKRTVYPGSKKVKVPESLHNLSAMTLPSLIFKTPKNQKRDVNAGLLILDSEKQMPSSNGNCNISSPCQSMEKALPKKAIFSTPSTSSTGTASLDFSFKTPSSSTTPSPAQSSVKKKKHSLLCKVLKKETKKSSSKGSLSLFLNSL